MIFITQLIYIRPGKEESFHEFEDMAIPLIAKYNGKLLLRIRPADADVIERNMEAPYEVHLVQFPSEEDIENFMHDDSRTKFLHLKEDSVQSAILIKGSKL